MIADELSRLKREESFKYARKKYLNLNQKMIFQKYKNLFSTTFISGEDERDLKNLRLADIEIVCTLGVGGFGRVELVNSFNLLN